MQPPKTGFSKKKSTILPTKYSAFLVEITGPIQITVTLLQSMHGALPGELNPHSFGINKKHHTFLCGAFLSGGDYRDRTGDLLHAMQALSRTTLKRTPIKACVNGYDLALIRQIRPKSDFLSNNQHSCMRTIWAQNSFGCILQSDFPAVKMFYVIHADWTHWCP